MKLVYFNCQRHYAGAASGISYLFEIGLFSIPLCCPPFSVQLHTLQHIIDQQVLGIFSHIFTSTSDTRALIFHFTKPAVYKDIPHKWGRNDFSKHLIQIICRRWRKFSRKWGPQLSGSRMAGEGSLSEQLHSSSLALIRFSRSCSAEGVEWTRESESFNNSHRIRGHVTRKQQIIPSSKRRRWMAWGGTDGGSRLDVLHT